MSWPLAIAIYFVVWWIVLFAVLPFGVHTQGESGEVVPGTPESAPRRFRMGRIFLVNTLLATVVFLGVWLVIELDLLGVGEMAAAVNR